MEITKSEINIIKLLKKRYDKETLKDFLELIKKDISRIDFVFNDKEIEIGYYSSDVLCYAMIIENRTNLKNRVITLYSPSKVYYNRLNKLLDNLNSLLKRFCCAYVYRNNLTIEKKNGVRVSIPFKREKLKVMKYISEDRNTYINML
jgi:hypothetical protein